MESLVDAIIVTSQSGGAESVQVYDVATGTLLKTYRGGIAAPSTLCFVGNADYMISAVKDKPYLQAWEVPRHQTMQIRLFVPGKANAMAISPAGPKYCVLGVGEKLVLYKLVSGRMIGVSNRHYQAITSLKFTPCGNYFASGAEDGFVYLWSLSSFIDILHVDDAPPVQPHRILGQHSDKVTGLAMTSSGLQGFLFSSSLDHVAKVFDLMTGHLVYNIISATGITSIACNTLGSQVFLGNKNGSVNVVNLLPHPPPGDVQVTSQTVCHANAVKCLAVTVTGNHLVTGGEDGDVKVWSITGASLGSLDNFHSHKASLALQKTVHTGRGRITNLTILRIEREALSDADRELKEVITPFSNEHIHPLNAVVKAPIKGRGKSQQHMNLINFTVDDCFESLNLDRPHGYKEDLEEAVIHLQENNKNLYQFAMKQILNSDSNTSANTSKGNTQNVISKKARKRTPNTVPKNIPEKSQNGKHMKNKKRSKGNKMQRLHKKVKK